MDNDMQGRAFLHSQLASAVSDGNLRLVRELVHSLGLSSSQQWLEGYALLVNAIKEKHTKIAKLLISSGAKLNSHCKEDCDTPLMLAVTNGDVGIVRMLLDRGADVDVKNKWGDTPVHMSVRYSYMQIVNMLLNRGVDVHVKDSHGSTPLHAAVTYGKVNMVEELIDRGSDVCFKDTKGCTLLHSAVEKGSKEIVTLLLNCYVNVNAKTTDGTTPLHIAAEKGHIQIAKVLLNHGADVHSACTSTERDGYMPIHFSAQLGSEEAVRFFLRKGADVNAKAKDNLTPLHLAIKAHHEAVVKLLLESGANVDARDKSGKTILHFAVEKGNSTIVEDVLRYCPDIINESNRSSLETTVQGSRDILQHGFIVNPEDVNNSELLHNAVTNGYLKTVGDLLKCGADVNMLDNSISGRGATPLHTAAMKDQVEIAKLLINYGANVHSKDKKEKTPIFYAVKQNNAEIIELFLTNGVNIKDRPDLLYTAAKAGCLETIEKLLKSGVDVNMSDNSMSGNSETALHFAAKYDQDDAVKLLINYGANVNAEDDWFDIPISHAIKMDNVEMTKLFLTNGANVKDYSKYLRIACARGCVEIVEDLLKYGVDVNYKYYDEMSWEEEWEEKTALYYIIRNKDMDQCIYSPTVNIDMDERIKIVQLLLSKGADVNAKTAYGISALHAAARYGYSEIIEILLNFGADIDSKDCYGRTALYIAVKEGHKQVVTDLLTNGIDINIVDEMGRTPLEFANDGAYDTDRHYDMYFSVNEYPRRLIPYVRIRISQILKDHIGKLKAAGFYVSKQNLKLISDDQYETYRFWYRCEREIHSMKDNKISNSDVSYYDILTKNTDQLAIYAENENIVQTLDTNDYKKKCRIYASMIEAKCRRCLVKQELTEIFNQFLNFLYKDLPVLPLHCTEKIFSGLSINDLQRLKHACQPLNSSNTSDSDAGSTSL